MQCCGFMRYSEPTANSSDVLRLLGSVIKNENKIMSTSFTYFWLLDSIICISYEVLNAELWALCIYILIANIDNILSHSL